MEAPPFRVLSSPTPRLLYEPLPQKPTIPPNSRAPDPYKLVPSTLNKNYAGSSGGGIGGTRSHRHSSFAIIAEPRPPSPIDSTTIGNSRPGSGRVSPFRGRGFKGPPPGARSRSESRRGSLSNHTSPKRSQIPRPAGGGAAVRTGNATIKQNGTIGNRPSPKFGRRASNGYNSSIANRNANNNNNNNNNRRTAQRQPELSPIQGSPAKRTTSNKVQPQANGQIPKAADRPSRNHHLVPPRLQPGGKRFITATGASTPTPASRGGGGKTTSKDNNNKNNNQDSPSRIPRRQGALGVSNSDSTLSLSQQNHNHNNNNNNVTAKKSTSSTAINNNNNHQNDGAASTQGTPQRGNATGGGGDDKVNRRGVASIVSSMSRVNKRKKASSSRESVQGDDDQQQQQPGLVDLLKQSTTGATGTSSVVNTTTTTAVQPLQIDASSILAEGELVAKLTSLERQQKQAEELQQQQQLADGNDGGSEASGSTTTTTTTGKHEATGTGADMTGSSSGLQMGNQVAQDNNDTTSTTTTTTTSTTKVRPRGSVFGLIRAKQRFHARLAAQEERRQHSRKQDNSTGNKSNNPGSKTSGGGSHESKRTSPREGRTTTTSDKEDHSSHHQTPAGGGRKKLVTPAVVTTAPGPTGTQETLIGAQPLSTNESESLGSLHSTDTGVSVNTVKGVSSAKEKTGLHVVKRPDEIETLSGNIVHLDNNGDRLSPGGKSSKSPRPGNKGGPSRKRPVNASQRWRKLRWLRFGQKKKKPLTGGTASKETSSSSGCWSKMRCLACKREPKGKPWPGKPGKRGQTGSTLHLTLEGQDNGSNNKNSNQQARITGSRWARIKEACRCASLRARARCRIPGVTGAGSRARRAQAAQVAPAGSSDNNNTTAGTNQTVRGCCPGGTDRRLGTLCRGLFSRCAPSKLSSCCSFSCCSCSCCSLPKCCRRGSEHPGNLRAKQSVGSVAPPPVSEENRPKLPDVLIEHNSVMRGAIPCLPVPIAWLCLICNVLAPGTGTTLSGLFNMCCGQPRFSATASPKARFGAFVVNIVVGVSQLFTVLFCLVGWGWSIWWGCTMLRVARKYKRFKETEAAANDPEAAKGPGDITIPAPGASQALRGGGTPAGNK